MAQKADQATKLILRVVTGTAEDGSAETANRTIRNVNPELTDAEMLSIGTKLGALQSYQVQAVARQDSADLVADA